MVVCLNELMNRTEYDAFGCLPVASMISVAVVVSVVP